MTESTDAAQPLLRLRGIGKSFGPVRALTDINLDIPPGQVTALVGDNGAGKSTLIKTVSGIWEPSGGQRQSVAVAKAIMGDAKLVIMDEPTAALGVSQTDLVLSLIDRLSSRGIAVLVISHNLTDVFRVADRLAVLYLGRLVSSGPLSDYDTSSAVHWMTTGTAPNNGTASNNGSAAVQNAEG